MVKTIRLTKYVFDRIYDRRKENTVHIPYQKDKIIDQIIVNLNRSDLGIGINSSSFQRSTRHNLFLEWDNEIPMVFHQELDDRNGELIRTGSGWHYIEYINRGLSILELAEQQDKYECCEGFRDYTKERGYSVLRLNPKIENELNIVRKQEDNLLYKAYNYIVESLHSKIIKLKLNLREKGIVV